MRATAPYNFVPASPTVVFPSWGELVSQDVPFQDGLCGHLDLEIIAHTPIFVRGQQSEGAFFETPDGHPALPGTSLRGMLRNVVQIASFGKLGPVNNHRFGIRDLDLKAYTSRMAMQTSGARFPLVSAGWLSLDGARMYDGDDEDGSARWVVQPCHFAKIHYRFLAGVASASGKSCFESVSKSSARAKYEGWQTAGLSLAQVCAVTKVAPAGAPPAGMRPNASGDYGEVSSVSPVTGGVPGVLVFTGQPSPWPEQRKAKHHEFFFHGAAGARLDVPWSLRQDFEFIHSRAVEQRGARDLAANVEWEFMRSQLTAAGTGATLFGGRRVPVFFLLDSAGRLEALGLAMMFRLAAKRTTVDVVKEAQPAATDTRLDLAEAIFGRVQRDDAATSALRGRVSLEAAVPVGSTRLLDPVEGVLGGPRASYYPNYLEQEPVRRDQKLRPIFKTFLDPDARARGWKRFPIRREVVDLPPAPTNEQGEVNREVLSTFAPLAAGAQFTTRLHFHNLRRVELGALLWALDFGGRTECRHGLGLAKAYGYGSVAVRVAATRLVPNDERSTYDKGLPTLRDEFRAFMEREVPSGWESSDQIYQLLSMARPPADAAQAAKLQPMTLESEAFRHVKQANGEPLAAYGDAAGLELHRSFCEQNPAPAPAFLPPAAPSRTGTAAHTAPNSPPRDPRPPHGPGATPVAPKPSAFDQKIGLIQRLGSSFAGQAGPYLDWFGTLSDPGQRKAAAVALVQAIDLKSVKRKAKEGSAPWAAVLAAYQAPDE